MPATRIVKLGERSVTVRELTVAEVRDWMVETETGAGQDPLHALVLEDCGLGDLARMSDVFAFELEAYAPSDLAELIAACKALNPHFFRMRAALSNVARVMLQEAEALASSATAADSSPMGTPGSGLIPGAPS